MSFIDHEIHYQRAPTPQQRTTETQYINEQGEREDRKMSLNTLLNNTEAAYDQDDKGSVEDEELASQDLSPSASPSPYSGGALIPIQSTPSPANTANRALCHICKSESGRCHASDPSTMQAFFANTLGFEGCLSTSDWLCMKCYSKWYNRCKRKAASSTSSLSTDGPSSSKRRRRRDKDVFTKRERQPSSDGEKDTDSDDALLLARMGQYTHVYSPTQHVASMPSSTNVSEREDSRDSESEVESLREEVRSLKTEMTRLVQQQAKRDEQMEGLLTFVKTEFSAMHDLFKELAEGRWVRPMPTPMPIPSGMPMTMPMPMQMQMPMPIPIREPPNLATRAQFAPKAEDARLCEA